MVKKEIEHRLLGYSYPSSYLTDIWMRTFRKIEFNNSLKIGSVLGLLTSSLLTYITQELTFNIETIIFFIFESVLLIGLYVFVFITYNKVYFFVSDWFHFSHMMLVWFLLFVVTSLILFPIYSVLLVYYNLTKEKE